VSWKTEGLKERRKIAWNKSSDKYAKILSRQVIWVEGLHRDSCEREILEKIVGNIRSFLKRTVNCINVLC